MHRQYRFSLPETDQEMAALPGDKRTSLHFKPALQFAAGHDLILSFPIEEAQHIC